MNYAKWIIYNLCPKDIKVQKKKNLVNVQVFQKL